MKLFQNYYFSFRRRRRSSEVILPEIISELFQRLTAAHEYFPARLNVQCRWNNFEIISAAEIISDVITCETSSSAMAERPRELDQRFQMGGGSIWGYYRLRSYFSRHYDTTQFTLTHHMVNKPFLLLGLAAEYRSRRQSTAMCTQHCGRPSDVYNTDRPTKLTALETISRWLILRSEKISLWATL